MHIANRAELDGIVDGVGVDTFSGPLARYLIGKGVSNTKSKRATLLSVHFHHGRLQSGEVYVKSNDFGITSSKTFEGHPNSLLVTIPRCAVVFRRRFDLADL